MIFNYTFLLLFISFLGCKKNDDGLPKATQTGANVIAAKIDGVIWKTKACFGCLGGGYGYDAVYVPSSKSIVLRGQMVDEPADINISMEIKVAGINGVGKYDLSDINNSLKRYARVQSGSLPEFYTYNPSTGSVTITKFSETEKIVSGTFEFNASNSASNKITVTNGVFDLTF